MHEGTDRFALATSTNDTALIAYLSGEIDLSNADAARVGLLEAAAVLPPPELAVLDLTAVSFFSAAAIHAVHDFATACAVRGIRTHLVVASDGIVCRVVSLAGLDKYVPTFSTLEQAV
jgi:anti-anti-sigma factor